MFYYIFFLIVLAYVFCKRKAKQQLFQRNESIKGTKGFFSLFCICILSQFIVISFAMNTMRELLGSDAHEHDSVFIANWKLKNRLSAQCAYSFNYLSFLSSVCGRVFFWWIFNFFSTHTQTHTSITRSTVCCASSTCIYAFMWFHIHLHVC